MIRLGDLTDSRLQQFLRHSNLSKQFPQFSALAQSYNRSRSRRRGCCKSQSNAVVILRAIRRQLPKLGLNDQKAAARMMGLSA